jgi:hypothetical protein
MPNKHRFDKPNAPMMGHFTRLQRTTAAQSAKELLLRRTPVLNELTGQAARQRFWRDWLGTRLPPELASKVSAVVEREVRLTIFARSAAWVARLRYAVRELEPEIRATAPTLATVQVRVLPGD